MAVHIDQCTFGSMTIDGRIYNRDLMIFPDGLVVDGWWRETGHRFSRIDIQPIVDAHPDVIVAGTGINGMVIVSMDLEITLSRIGIELQVFKTQSAVSAFNRLTAAGKPVAGCFHLTC